MEHHHIVISYGTLFPAQFLKKKLIIWIIDFFNMQKWNFKFVNNRVHTYKSVESCTYFFDWYNVPKIRWLVLSFRMPSQRLFQRKLNYAKTPCLFYFLLFHIWLWNCADNLGYFVKYRHVFADVVSKKLTKTPIIIISLLFYSSFLVLKNSIQSRFLLSWVGLW